MVKFRQALGEISLRRPGWMPRRDAKTHYSILCDHHTACKPQGWLGDPRRIESTCNIDEVTCKNCLRIFAHKTDLDQES